jgi:hypothetical protein
MSITDENDDRKDAVPGMPRDQPPAHQTPMKARRTQVIDVTPTPKKSFKQRNSLEPSQ